MPAAGTPTESAQKFDFYVNLGDTIYETASTGSAAVNVTVNPSSATTDGVFTSGATQCETLISLKEQSGSDKDKAMLPTLRQTLREKARDRH